jgi:hypothetical protein
MVHQRFLHLLETCHYGNNDGERFLRSRDIVDQTIVEKGRLLYFGGDFDLYQFQCRLLLVMIRLDGEEYKISVTMRFK